MGSSRYLVNGERRRLQNSSSSTARFASGVGPVRCDGGADVSGLTIHILCTIGMVLCAWYLAWEPLE